MANEQNLKPFTSDQSREEAKKNGHKGGIQLGINNEKRRTYKEQLETVIKLGEERALEKAKKEGNLEAVKMIEDGGLIAFEKLNIALNKKVKVETRLKALNDIVDRIEGKPTQKNELSGLDGQPLQPFQVIVEGVKPDKGE
jgi:hypothetical protein